MWIEPTCFRPDVGRTLGVPAARRPGLPGRSAAARSRAHRQFVVVDGDQTKPVVGRDGADPAGLAACRGARSRSSSAITANRAPSFSRRTKFNQYLTEEGWRPSPRCAPSAARPTPRRASRSSRCAKSLLLAGPPQPRSSDRALGFPLELVAERNPYMLTAGADLRRPAAVSRSSRSPARSWPR